MSITFAKGLFCKTASPDFVVCKLSIIVDDFIEFLNENKNNAGYVNIDVLKSKSSDKIYGALNEWKKKENTEENNNYADDSFDSIPF